MKHLVAQPHILMSVQNPYHPTSSEISHEEAIGVLSGGGKYNNVHSAKGKYGNSEDTIFISNPSEAQIALAHKIAEETGQDSLIESDGHSHKIIATNGSDKGSVMHGRGTTWHEQEPEDYYTTLPTGEHFTHNFDEANQNVEKSEDLEKSKNVREQRAKVFGTDPNAPRISNKRMKMMQAIQGYAQKKYGLPLVTASGKRDISGQLKEEKGIEQQPYDVFTPQGLAEEKARQEKVKQLGLKRMDPKPDWKSGQLETQPSPDAAVHELAHLDLAPEGMTAPEFQDLMDRRWGESQKKYGHMQQKKTQGEIQPMALENPLRRELGLPANRATKPVTEGQTALDDPNQQRFVQGKDSKGRPVFYDRQSRLMNPETKERLTQIREGSVKFDPKGGWQPSSDVDALINLRGRGMAGEAQRRAKQKFSSSAQPPEQSSVLSIDDLLSHQGSIDELKQKIKQYAESQPKKLASSEEMSKAEQLRKRCWEGYRPVPGKKPYSKGSCAPIKKNHINKNESTRQPSAIEPEPEAGEHPFLRHVTKKYGYHDEHPVKKFFKEWVDTTQEHPFVPHRIHGFENPENPENPIFAFSNLKPDHYNPQTTVLIDWLQSDEKGSGAGSQALKEITNLADKHGVNLSLIAGASPNAKIKTTAPSRLKRFYGRHGFQSESGKGSYMVRPANAGQITKSDEYIFHPEDEDAIHELFTDSSEKLEMAEKPFHGYNKEKHSRTGGLSDKYREKYNRETGSNLKRPVTGKVKAGSKAAGRRKSFCARMSGVKGPTSKDGKLTPKGAALKRWKCSKSEELEKGALGDWQKEGYKISHEPWTEYDDNDFKVFAHDKDGNLVGETHILNYPDVVESHWTDVHPSHRRKGIASAMYQYAEKLAKKPIQAAEAQSDTGKSLWSQPNRPFGKSDLEKGKLEHYSSQQGLKTIDPKFKGRGVDIRTKGRDTEHPHSFFYRAGTLPEDVVASGAKSKYTVEIPDSAPLYDLATDNQGHIASAIEQNQGALNMDMVHQNLKDAGYQGFYNSAHPQLFNVVALYHEQPVSEEHGVQKQEGTDCDDHLDPLKKPYASEAQRHWAHTPAGKKALGGEKAVAHWDKASRGKDLPEKIKKKDLIKGSFQRKNKLNMSPEQFDNVKGWVNATSTYGQIPTEKQKQLRDNLPNFSEITNRLKQKLGKDTKIMRHPDTGEMMALLHRGVSLDEYHNSVENDRVNHKHKTSWTTNEAIAQSFARSNGSYNGQTISAWVPLSKIISAPYLIPAKLTGNGNKDELFQQASRYEKEIIVDSDHNSFLTHDKFNPPEDTLGQKVKNYKQRKHMSRIIGRSLAASEKLDKASRGKDLPEKVKKKELIKGANGDWQKENLFIRHSLSLDDHKKGNVTVSVWHPSSEITPVGRLEVKNGQVVRASVHPYYQRKGVATAMYDQAEKLIGTQLQPGVEQSRDAIKFWEKRVNKSEKLEKVSREEVAQSHILMFPVSINGQHKDEHENIPDYHITLKWMGNNPHKTPEEIQNIVQKHGLTPPESFDLHPHIFNTPNGPVHVLLLNGNLDSLHHAKREIDIGNPDRYPSYLPHITVPKKIHDAVKEHGLTAKDLNIQVHPLEYRVGEQTIKRYE